MLIKQNSRINSKNIGGLKMDYKINEIDLQKVINYLASKPYGEVFEIIQKLIKLEKIEEIKK